MYFALRNFVHSRKHCEMGKRWDHGDNESLVEKGFIKKFDSEIEAEAFFAAKFDKIDAVKNKGANSKDQAKLLSREKKEQKEFANPEPKEVIKEDLEPVKGKKSDKKKK